MAKAVAKTKDVLAIVNTGGKQYPVREGDTITVEKLDAEVGATVELDTVGAFSDDGALADTAPKVQAEVVRQFRDRKIVVFKKKRRKGYHKKQGHRQSQTELRIAKIG